MDITNVTVSNDDSATLTFVIAIPGQASLPTTKLIGIQLNTDLNPETGENGFDYLVWIDGTRGTRELQHWNGSAWIGVPGSGVTGNFSQGQTIQIKDSAFGSPSSFDFSVQTWQWDGTRLTSEDRAPDSGNWRYNVVIRQTPPPPTRALAIKGLTKTPKTPEAGGSFKVSAKVVRIGWSGRFNGKVHCRGTIGGRRAVWVGSVKPGLASCTTNVPANAGGRPIKGSIKVSENGADTAEQLFAAHVRPTPTLSTGDVSTSPPTGPVAGSQFYYTVEVFIRTGSGAAKRITTGTVECHATRDGIALRSIQGASQVRPNKDVLCGWEVPYRSSGETIQGVIVVRSGGATLTHRFKLRIR